MLGIDWETVAYKFCDIVAWTAPRPLALQANTWRWQFKAATGTIYPEGVFILAAYLVMAICLLAILAAVPRIAELLARMADRAGSAQSPSSPSLRAGSRTAGT